MTTLKQTINVNFSGDGRPAISKKIESIVNNATGASFRLVNDTSQALLQAIRKSGLKSMYLVSNIAATITWKDSGGTSVGSVTLAPEVPYIWTSQSGQANPISDDVAMWNVSSAAEGTLDYAVGQDMNPAEATVALTGTLLSGHLESGVVGGTYTAILTLTGATWLPAGAAFNAQRQAIIDGFVAATSQTDGWNNHRNEIGVTAVVRTSASVVTVTLPAIGDYDIASNETITVTVPAPATTAAQVMVASPTVTITAGS